MKHIWSFRRVAWRSRAGLCRLARIPCRVSCRIHVTKFAFHPAKLYIGKNYYLCSYDKHIHFGFGVVNDPYKTYGSSFR